MGFHMPRAQTRFREQGLNLDPLPSETIVGKRFPDFIKEYKMEGIYIGEQLAEIGYRVIQSIPVLRKIAERHVESARS
jgi:hypothetical protein